MHTIVFSYKVTCTSKCLEIADMYLLTICSFSGPHSSGRKHKWWRLEGGDISKDKVHEGYVLFGFK